MHNRTLKEILNDKVTQYLKIDNKKPETIYEKGLALFSGSGEEGRVRAKQYRKNVLNNLNDFELERKVYLDVTQYLGNSKQFRTRLLEGLCEYYSVSNNAIDDERRAFCSAIALVQSIHSTPPFGDDELYRKAMKTLLAKEVPEHVKSQKKSIELKSM